MEPLADAVQEAATALALGKDAPLLDIITSFGLPALFAELAGAGASEYADRVAAVLTAALSSPACHAVTLDIAHLPHWTAGLSAPAGPRGRGVALRALTHLLLTAPASTALLTAPAGLTAPVVAFLAEEDLPLAAAASKCLRAAALALQGDAPALAALLTAIAAPPPNPCAMHAPRLAALLARLAGDASATAAALGSDGLAPLRSALDPADPLGAMAALEAVPAAATSPGGVVALCSGAPSVMDATLALAGAQLPLPGGGGLALPAAGVEAAGPPDAFVGAQALRVAGATVRSAAWTLLAAAAGRYACGDVTAGPLSPTAATAALAPLLVAGRGVLWRAGEALAAGEDDDAVGAALAAAGDVLGAHPLLAAAGTASPPLVAGLAATLAGSDAGRRDAALHAVSVALAAPAGLGAVLGLPTPRVEAAAPDPDAAWLASALARRGGAAAPISPPPAASHATGAGAGGGGDPDASPAPVGGIVPATPAASPLLLSHGGGDFVAALDAALAAAPAGCRSLAAIAGSAVATPFADTGRAGFAALTALVAQPTAWGLRYVLHSDEALAAWLCSPGDGSEAVLLAAHRRRLLGALLGHGEAKAGAGAVLYEALTAALAAAQGGGSAAPVVGSAAS